MYLLRTLLWKPRGAISLHLVTYSSQAWIYTRRADGYLEAALNLARAESILAPLSLNVTLGRITYWLATLSFWQGKIERAKTLLARADRLIDAGGDQVDKLDARLLALYLDGPEEDHSFPVEEFQDIFENYRRLSSHYSTALCLYFLYRKRCSHAVEVANKDKRLWKYLESSGCLFAEALKLHLEAFADRQDSNPDPELLKKAFVGYRNAGHYFHALVTTRQIADHYCEMGYPRLADSFLQEAVYLAETLDNPTLKGELLLEREKALNSIQHDQSDPNLLKRISSLLNSLDDFPTIALELLRLALNITAAERGVLFLADEEGKQLKLEASIDCDGQSIADITAISQGVIKSVYENSSPLIVDDAMASSLTKAYKSVISHNILSILCVPLYAQGKLTGVLYLDHHSLPGLFSEKDRSAIQALAGFIAVALTQARLMRALRVQNLENTDRLREHGVENPFQTASKAGLDIISKIPIIARSEANVLLTGESGTGKEILAKMIHDASSRKDGPFVALNCAGLKGELVESRLFGIVKGTATGVSGRGGKFQDADGGTLFLDEIADLPLSTQGLLLRTLESRQIDVVGSHKVQAIDVRLVTATNKKLEPMLQDGTFRHDLYYRINTVQIEIPPLRERKEDMTLLLDYFLELFGKSRGLRLTPRAKQALVDYSWPGNVRELRNEIERLSVITESNLIDLDLLQPRMVKSDKPSSPVSLKSMIARLEKEMVEKALRDNNWNQSAAARSLGISPPALQRLIKKYKIKFPPRH